MSDLIIMDLDVNVTDAACATDFTKRKWKTVWWTRDRQWSNLKWMRTPRLMDAASITDWSKMDANDHLIDEASISAQIFDVLNKYGCSFDGLGHSFLNKYVIQKAVPLHFDKQKHPRPYSVSTCFASILDVCVRVRHHWLSIICKIGTEKRDVSKRVPMYGLFLHMLRNDVNCFFTLCCDRYTKTRLYFSGTFWEEVIYTDVQQKKIKNLFWWNSLPHGLRLVNLGRW